MATAQELVDFALGEVGYSRWDDPLPGTKYGRWYAEYTGSPYFGTSGVPFCAMGMSYCAYHVGVSSPVTPSAVAFDEGNDFQGRYVDKYSMILGDFVAFDWDDDTSGDHVGIVLEPLGGGVYNTIEFNTGDGVVAICTRYPSQIICGCRPWYDECDAPEQDGIAVDGAGGTQTVSAWQRAMGTTVDGVISDQYEADHRYRKNVWSVDYTEDPDSKGSSLVSAVQKFLISRGYSCGDAGVDGLWGRCTSEAIQKFLKDGGYYDGEIDCDFGPNSVRALQKSLNDGVWDQE